jgi:hypothetical protein
VGHMAQVVAEGDIMLDGSQKVPHISCVVGILQISVARCRKKLFPIHLPLALLPLPREGEPAPESQTPSALGGSLRGGCRGACWVYLRCFPVPA